MGCTDSQENQETIHARSKISRLEGRRKSLQKTIQEEFQEISEDLTKQEIEQISTTLKDHFLFSSLDRQSLHEVCLHFGKCTGQKDQYIFRQSDKASCFFIVGRGKMKVEINCKDVRELEEGQPFGELALMYSAPRSSSIKIASDRILLYYLKQSVFQDVIHNILETTLQETKEVVGNIKIFNYLTSRQKYTLLSNLLKVKYAKDQAIFNRQDDANCLYIVKKGKVRIQIPDKEDVFVNENQYFGESGIYSAKIRSGIATAIEQTECFTLSFQAMKDLLGSNMNNLIYYNIERWAIRRSGFMETPPNKLISQILNAFTVNKATKFQVLKRKQDAVKLVFIPLNCKFNDSTEINAYGMEALKSDRSLQIYDLVATEQGNYASAPLSAIIQLIEAQQAKSRRLLGTNHKTMNLKTTSLEVSIKNLRLGKKLGSGQFGQVYLAEDQRFGTKFAVKKIDKKQLKEMDLLDSVIREKQLLEAVASPFIESFYKVEADKDSIYLILEYIKGVELFDTLRQIGLLPETTAKYYLSSVILGLEDLHSKSILYRDIKPENIIITSKGEVVIIDLGTAKKLVADNQFRTFTIIGTPHYMAPEMTEGKGYSLEIDYWSVGILLYQFVRGRLPFGNSLQDPYKIFREIRKKKVHFPEYLNRETVKLIQMLLVKSPSARLRNGWEDAKDSEYLSSFDWEALRSGEMESPYIPQRFRKVSYESRHQSGNTMNFDLQTLKKWDETLG